ncbi:MAG: cation:proton antiporter [Candidatus Marinimicrobia bacterium]|nr:cation:proton antiporter [Candidatus Neomarinimicrobiota bacterium]MDD5582473.1 cation:proton antiporter [Candidatus Neomarinimicrobiota bacterium]
MNLLVILFLTVITVGLRYFAQFLSLPTMPNPTLMLGLILISSWVIGSSIKYKSLPALVGFVLYGLAASPSGLNLLTVQDIQSLAFIQFMVFMLIGFLLGGHIDFKRYKDLTSLVPRLMGIQLVLLFLLTTVFLWGIHSLFPEFSLLNAQNIFAFAFILTLFFASTSPAVIFTLHQEVDASGRVKTIIEITSIFMSLLILLFLFGDGILLKFLTGTAQESSASHAVYTFFKHFFAVLMSTLGIGLFLRFFLSAFKEGFIVFLLIVILCLFKIGKNFFPECITCFIGVGMIVRYQSKRGKKMIKNIQRYSLPLFILFFTLTATHFTFFKMESPCLLLLLVPFFFIRFVGLQVSTTLFFRIKNKEEHSTRTIAKGFLPQSALTLFLLTLLPRLGEFAHIKELSSVLTWMVFLNLLFGASLFKASFIRNKADQHDEN